MANKKHPKTSSLTSGLHVSGHERRSVTFKNTPDVHVMTPQCTPPLTERGGWAGRFAHSNEQENLQPCSLPAASPPCRIRIIGPYESLAATDPCADDSASPQLLPSQPEHQPSWYQRLKSAAKALKHEVLAMYYAMQHPLTPLAAKVLAALVLAYALSPLDLIPDFIPVLGILDDLLLLPLMIAAAIALVPGHVMEDCRRRAKEEPLRLGRNWFMATLIASLWLACLELLSYWLVMKYGTSVMKKHLPYGMASLAAVCIGGFALWLVRKVRKERRKQRKAEAAAERQKVAVAVAAGGLAPVTVIAGDADGDGQDQDLEAALHCIAGLQADRLAAAGSCREPLLSGEARNGESEARD